MAGPTMTAPTPPELYRNADHESPVHGAPDDLLLIPGHGLADGDQVSYEAVADTGHPPPAPRQVPEVATADGGWAPVVSYSNAPYSLTVQLPPILRAHQSYALRVRSLRGNWSAPMLINDARPLWATPATVYSSRPVASLPRELKVVGRNLEAAPGRATRIRLDGPQHYEGTSIRDSLSSDTLDPYVARLRLPKSLLPGRYHIALSRDGISWVAMTGQTLEVLADPATPMEFSLDDPGFGGCRPDDGRDDTPCILRALEAARLAGGGVVKFGPGTWDLVDSGQPGVMGDEGIIVPTGVSLQGAGRERTRVERHTAWNERAPAAAAFTLLGRSQVAGFTLRDQKRYQASDRAGPFLQLGVHASRAAAPAPSRVDDVVVTDNLFDNTLVAVGNDGLPLNRLFITYNTFAAFHSALGLAGNQANTAIRYRIDDSVIAHNLFKPSSKLDLVEKSANVASELGSGFRVDFSANVADGAAGDFLYEAGDPKGWRAAFFWNLSGNVEETLIAQNSASCTGDKIGDGEAISLDNNANTFAFGAATVVASATADTVSVAARPVSRQHQREVPVLSYYVGHWVQLAAGPGLGQARRIAAYSTNALTGVTTFKITPAWDVVPVAGRTRMAVGREFWQVYLLDNQIDNRRPLCEKSNRSRKAAGVISVWGQSADSVIAGNRQFDSDGIFVQQVYSVPEHPCADCAMESWFQYFLEIHDNLVDGEYAWDSSCSSSGIAIGIGASESGDLAPPTVGYGISIAHNEVRHADAQFSGAIAQTNSWSGGPPPHRWPLSENLLIHHNRISDIDGAPALPECVRARPRIAIAFPDDAVAWHTVLYANSCRNVSAALGPGGVGRTVLCPSGAEESCGCTAEHR